MALKQFFTNLINTNWGDITSPTRVPLKDREVGNALVDALYPTTIIDSQATTNVFTRGSIQTVFNYFFTIKKRGNIVFISGYIINSSSTNSSVLEDITAITNTEFQPQSTQTIIGTTTASQRVLLTFVASGVNRLSGNSASIPPNSTITFNGFYFTND